MTTMTERTAVIPHEAAETEEKIEESSTLARHRRRPQIDKCHEAVDALLAQGNWPPNQTRDEQYDRVCAYLKDEAGYAVLPSRPTFSRVMLKRERDNRP